MSRIISVIRLDTEDSLPRSSRFRKVRSRTHSRLGLQVNRILNQYQVLDGQHLRSITSEIMQGQGILIQCPTTYITTLGSLQLSVLISGQLLALAPPPLSPPLP